MDTNGSVYLGEDEGHYFWSDLTPFAQGYIKALSANEDEAALADFSDFAPETLASIIMDCSSFQNIARSLGQQTGMLEGRYFWTGRQRGVMEGALGAAFPPIIVSLSDDGKVRFS